MASKDQEIESLQERHHVELKVSTKPYFEYVADSTVLCTSMYCFVLPAELAWALAASSTACLSILKLYRLCQAQ